MGEHKFPKKVVEGAKEVTPEEQADIDADKKLSHAVSVTVSELRRFGDERTEIPDNTITEQAIEAAYGGMRDRATAAQMVPLSTSISMSTCVVNDRPYLTLVLIVNWMDREELEIMQRRQALIGGPGPRGA
ncbi:MAG: hypothetical protein ACRDL7_00100 [Gaiellaceae bacterium]